MRRASALPVLVSAGALLLCGLGEGSSPAQPPEIVFYQLSNMTASGRPPQKLLLRNRLPCSCQGWGCGCCAGMSVQAFNFDRNMCMNLTYDPYEFSMTATMLMNEEVMYENSISGKNPPPLCVPVPIPYLPSIDFCLRFFNIFTPGTNLHMCMDMEARVQRAPVLVLHFDCVRVGADGLAMVKPEDDGGLPLPPADEDEGGEVSEDDPVEDTGPPTDDTEDEVYDEVAPGRRPTARTAPPGQGQN